ncbi:MAG: aminodeoxychorismate/anthranilate synthase component II [Deltaproteobacteria bacterium]|nr:aminodeoxychorismate/anthranilate synthase component II [Deltaproteobacteria bacterium]
MILLIDNYDSFTFNLLQYLEENKISVAVVKNDHIFSNKLILNKCQALVISPGPGVPETSGEILRLIQEYAQKKPILGVCLGHQALNNAFGGRLKHAQRIMHGKTSRMSHDGRGVFLNLPQETPVMRYHSFVVDEEYLPTCLKVTARAEDGSIMGLRHESLPLEGVQFHPESILTSFGKAIIKNFLDFNKLVNSV